MGGLWRAERAALRGVRMSRPAGGYGPPKGGPYGRHEAPRRSFS